MAWTGAEPTTPWRGHPCAGRNADPFSFFENYAEQYLQGILSRNSGIGYYNYKKKELGVAGRIKLLEGVIVHVEGKNYPSVDQAIDRSALIMRNPEANFFTDIAYTDKYLVHIVVSILLYVALLFPIWCRVASWSVLRLSALNSPAKMQPAVLLTFQRRYVVQQMRELCTLALVLVFSGELFFSTA